jgi:hypothetical protein
MVDSILFTLYLNINGWKLNSDMGASVLYSVHASHLEVLK